ncbi:hypothetical protein [Microterricola viridarii]|nr:hypothetical protein [Microterricola viridarii]
MPGRVLTDTVDRTPPLLDPTQRHPSAALRRWILYPDDAPF